MKNALNETTNSPHGKAMGPVLTFVNTQAQIQIGIVENNLKQLKLNMPLAPENIHQRKKNFLALFCNQGQKLS